MTTKLVTLKQAKDHLRIEPERSVEDDDVGTKIEQASSIILDYLKLSALPAEWDSPSGDSPAPKNVPAMVQAATLLVVGELYRNREAGSADVLSQTVKDLLHRLRDPALA